MLTRAPIPTPAPWWGQDDTSVDEQENNPGPHSLPAAPAPNTGGKILPQTPVVSSEFSRGFGHGYWMNEQKQKKDGSAS